jgi:hypothetical protein
MVQAEQELLPEAVRLFAQGRLRVEGRRVVVLPESTGTFRTAPQGTEINP